MLKSRDLGGGIGIKLNFDLLFYIVTNMYQIIKTKIQASSSMAQISLSLFLSAFDLLSANSICVQKTW